MSEAFEALDQEKSELENELAERIEAIDELSGILGGSFSCPSFVPYKISKLVTLTSINLIQRT